MDGNAAPTASSSNSPTQQRSPPIPLNKRTSSKHALRDTFNDASPGSPPSTPPHSRRRTKKREKGKQPLRAYASAEGGINKRHSHGLSWSSTTRDSVVDNLLFSLDNLSRPDIAETDEPVRDPSFDRAKYRMPDLPPLPAMPSNRTAQRARGHTYSSSLSTDYEPTAMSDSPTSFTTPPKGRRSNSSSNHPIHTSISSKMRSSKMSKGSISSVETQKPAPIGVYTKGDTSRKDSTEVGSADFLYSSLPTINRPARSRRSLSMDQIYSEPSIGGNSVLDRGRPVPSVHSKYESSTEVAPEPSIPGGPRKKDNPTAIGAVYVNQAQPKSSLRKITTQTDLRSASNPLPSPPIPQNIRSQASDFVRANSIRGTPSIPTIRGQSKAPPSPALQTPVAKNSAPVQKERPGFFKRVFGSSTSRTNSVQTDRSTSLEDADVPSGPGGTSSSNGSQARTGTRQASREQPAGTTHAPPSLHKKSSFFRRRKKSSSENQTPPPLPLGGNNNLKVPAAEPSPSASSLRKVMDPYLANDGKPANGVPGVKRSDMSRPTTQESSAEDSDSLDIFHSGYTPPPDASLGMRDPLSRSPSTKPKPSVEQDIWKTKMKVKKRKPDKLVETKGGMFVDTTNIVVSPTADSAKVSPITDVPPDNKENQRPASKASTGDRIIAGKASTPVESNQDTRKPSVVSSIVSSDRADDSFVRPSAQDRPESKKSDRLYLQPSAEELMLNTNDDLAPISEHSRNVSQADDSAKSPAFHTARSGTFASEVHSPITPSTQYHSATSLPLPSIQADRSESNIPEEANGVTPPPIVVDEGAEYRERARKIFHGNEEDVAKPEAASWLGERNTLSSRTLDAYMQIFEFASVNILSALRTLCGKLALRGETQQFDRIISALSTRWCDCNPNHGFKAQDVVHTICYSLILLNTDLHLADIGEKMSRSAYVKNTLPTIRRVVTDAAPNAFDETVRPGPIQTRPTLPWRSDSRDSIPKSPSFPPTSPNNTTPIEQDRAPLSKRLSMRPTFDRTNSDGNSPDAAAASNAFVNQPWTGTMRGWEIEIESILKSFFVSIRTDPLPLFGTPMPSEPAPVDRNLSVANLGGLKRTNSTVSKAPSDNTSFRSRPGFRNMTMGFQSKYNRSRPKLYPTSTLASSRTSFDDGNSVWSPGQSSTWSKYSFSKTLTSASMQSLGQHFTPSVGDFKHSIGFANALSQAIIREENAGGSGGGTDNESVSMSVPGGLLEDEALALEGAPWAKEGLVKHKHHLETPGKKAKERSWNDCFAVISKGKLTLFAFNTSTKTLSIGRKAMSKQQSGGRLPTATAPRVGGGDWMENAEQLDVFVLRQTIASTLPPPGYSKTRPHVWALSLPSGAVHLFQVGTPEIAHEFMSTANYWSARLSKEPLSGGVSNIEYGWSDQMINMALVDRPLSPPVTSPPPPPSIQNRQQHGHMHSNSRGEMGRPSMTSSIRTSLDAGFSSRLKLPGDKVHLTEWHPPTQSMMASQLMEVDQLKALTAYVSNVEAELAKHNDLKHAIELAYSPRHTNYNRALANWQRKSDHLLREIVKFQTYVDSLGASQKSREAFYANKNLHESGDVEELRNGGEAFRAGDGEVAV